MKYGQSWQINILGAIISLRGGRIHAVIQSLNYTLNTLWQIVLFLSTRLVANIASSIRSSLFAAYPQIHPKQLFSCDTDSLLKDGGRTPEAVMVQAKSKLLFTQGLCLKFLRAEYWACSDPEFELHNHIDYARQSYFLVFGS